MKSHTALLFSCLLVIIPSCKQRESAQTADPTSTTSPAPPIESTPAPESLPPSPETIARNEAKIASWTHDAPPPASAELYSRFLQAIEQGDIPAAENMAAEAEKSNPSSPLIPVIQTHLLLARKDWAGTEKLLADNPPASHAIIRTIGSRLAFSPTHADIPADLIAKAAQSFTQSISGNPHATPMDWLALSTLQFKSGNTDAAKLSARSAVDAAKKIPPGHSMPHVIYEKFANQIDQGNLPSIDDISLWTEATDQSPPP